MCEKCKAIYGMLLADRLLERVPMKLPFDQRDEGDNEVTSKLIADITIAALGPLHDGQTDVNAVSEIVDKLKPATLYQVGQAAAAMRDVTDYIYDLMVNLLGAQGTTGDLVARILTGKLIHDGGPTNDMIEGWNKAEDLTAKADAAEREQHEHAGFRPKPPSGPVS